MTREKKPDFCDICGNVIESESVYKFKVEQKYPYGSDKITEGQPMDCCHPCFIGICKRAIATPHEYKPNWKYYTRNPAWSKGSKEPYKFERVLEQPQKKIAEGGYPVGASKA